MIYTVEKVSKEIQIIDFFYKNDGWFPMDYVKKELKLEILSKILLDEIFQRLVCKGILDAAIRDSVCIYRISAFGRYMYSKVVIM